MAKLTYQPLGVHGSGFSGFNFEELVFGTVCFGGGVKCLCAGQPVSHKRDGGDSDYELF